MDQLRALEDAMITICKCNGIDFTGISESLLVGNCCSSLGMPIRIGVGSLQYGGLLGILVRTCIGELMIPKIIGDSTGDSIDDEASLQVLH